MEVLKLSCNSLQDEGAEAVGQLLLENASIKEYFVVLTIEFIWIITKLPIQVSLLWESPSLKPTI